MERVDTQEAIAEALVSMNNGEAPINHPAAIRDAVDVYRNRLMTIPATLAEAIGLTFVALEFYEHAVEWFQAAAVALENFRAQEDEWREAAIGALMGKPIPKSRKNQTPINTGDVGACSSRSAAEKVVDTTPHMVAFLSHRAELAQVKADAEKELGVARRRHATAIAAQLAFTVAGDRAALLTQVTPLTPLSDMVAARVAGMTTPLPDLTKGDTDPAFTEEP